MKPYFKKTITKKGWRSGSRCEPEFKPRYNNNNKKHKSQHRNVESQGNVISLKVHKSLVTDFKGTEMNEMPKNLKMVLNMISESKEDTNEQPN
jgi:hypothetical protein